MHGFFTIGILRDERRRPRRGAPRRINTLHCFRINSVCQPQRLPEKPSCPAVPREGPWGGEPSYVWLLVPLPQFRHPWPGKIEENFTAPPFRNETLTREALVPIGPLNNVHLSGVYSFKPVSTAQIICQSGGVHPAETGSPRELPAPTEYKKTSGSCTVQNLPQRSDVL